jgi:hypothetical protein
MWDASNKWEFFAQVGNPIYLWANPLWGRPNGSRVCVCVCVCVSNLRFECNTRTLRQTWCTIMCCAPSLAEPPIAKRSGVKDGDLMDSRSWAMVGPRIIRIRILISLILLILILTIITIMLLIMLLLLILS